MKRILITGANSYIGTSLERYLDKWPEKYSVDTINVHETRGGIGRIGTSLPSMPFTM